MAAVNCAAEGKPPPLELEYAWQSRDHPGALPEPGGLRDQPVKLMTRMRSTYNIWTCVKDYFANGMSANWTLKNPEKWKVVGKALKLKADFDRQELNED